MVRSYLRKVSQTLSAWWCCKNIKSLWWLPFVISGNGRQPTWLTLWTLKFDPHLCGSLRACVSQRQTTGIIFVIFGNVSYPRLPPPTILRKSDLNLWGSVINYKPISLIVWPQEPFLLFQVMADIPRLVDKGGYHKWLIKYAHQNWLPSKSEFWVFCPVSFTMSGFVCTTVWWDSVRSLSEFSQ